MAEILSPARRHFLKTSVVTTGSFAVAFYVPSILQKAFAEGKAPSPALEPNAFIQINADNSIVMTINKLEMGQGVNTSMAQLIAEELDCDWTKIRCVSAPVAPVYNHTAFGTQMTGGSSALNSSWDQHRQIGAGMREMLKKAAADQWKVPVGEVRAENGFIVHPGKDRLSYGELANAANQQAFPQNPPLKDPKDFKIIGKSQKRVDAPDKSSGKAIFGIDVRTPDMLYAVIARPPVPGAKLISFHDKPARAVSGVVDVVKFGDKLAVLGRSTHAARTGRDALEIKWNSQGKDDFSHDSLMADFRQKASEKGLVAGEKGKQTESLISASKKKIVSDFEFPYLCHAPMEPMNCTIRYDGKEAEIWSGHQMPTTDRDAAAKVLGLPLAKVKVNTVYAGGSFGRRANKNSDYTIEAAELAKIVKKPLKVVWTREDDMRGGYYRPMNFHRVTLAFDEKNQFQAWDHHIVGQTVIGGSMFEPMMVKNGIESTITEGVSDTPYEFPQFRCLQTRMQTPVTTLWWRSVGHTHTAYVMETMMDELAEATKKDPLKLRRELLKNSPRHLAVLDLLEKNSGWGKRKPPKGRAWGLAIHESFNSVVGHVAEVSMENGQPKVHRVWSAVHCGTVVNPDGAKTQVEGAIAYGLSAAFYEEIKIAAGQVQTGNYHDFPVLRMNEMPKVEVAFAASTDKPTGLGEPGLPPIAPAVANAIYRLTKKRLRKLPFQKELQT